MRHKRDANHGEIVQALEAVGVTVCDTSMAGSGFPDLLCYRRSTGILRLIEIKNPKTVAAKHRKADRKKSNTEKAQEAFALRFPVWKVRTWQEALAAMGLEVL